jgi:hypothetical protein
MKKIISTLSLLTVLAFTAFSAGNSPITGFYHLTIPAGKMISAANQMWNGSDVASSNEDINQAFQGLFSDSTGRTNAIAHIWNGAGYDTYKYFNAADASTFFNTTLTNTGFYDQNANLINGSLPPGAACYLLNPALVPCTLLVQGFVPVGTNSVVITPGYNLYSIPLPVSTSLANSNAYANYAGTSDPAGKNNDVIQIWTGTNYQSYIYFKGSDASTYFNKSGLSSGFYTATGTPVTITPSIGSGFFIYHAGTNVTWSTKWP